MGEVRMELYLENLRSRYRQTDKKGRQLLLDELVQSMGYHRKSACRLLNQTEAKKRSGGSKGTRGAPKLYEEAVLLEPLKRLWMDGDCPCGKRLKPMLALWLPFYEKHYPKLEPKVYSALLSMSPATIDRLLKPLRHQRKKPLCTTKPGSLLRSRIPVRTNFWDVTKPGYVEGDTVSHCGGEMDGEFISSLTVTDIVTGWTENRAFWRKHALATLNGIRSIESAFPFPFLGFDSDNGGEFINHYLHAYFTKRPEGKQVAFTRARAYQKNDNAYVEQKNWTHVRQVFGYERLDDPKLVKLMNDIYRNELSVLRNFFTPAMKLHSRQRFEAKVIKTFKTPQTPYERVMESPHVSDEAKQLLRQRFEQFDPIEISKKLRSKLILFHKQVEKSWQKQTNALTASSL